MKQNRKVFPSNLMSEVTSNTVLEMALKQVSKCREKDTHNSDIWHVRFYWPKIKEEVRHTLLNGTYQLSPVQVCGNKDGHRLTRWTAIDAIVLKAISIVLTEPVQDHIDKRCYHIKGNGGVKGAINKVHDFIKGYQFVVKSDIADFYASMNHQIVMEHCKQVIKDKSILMIIQQYLTRVEITHGDYDLIKEGIVKGCPLSPLMGAIMLKFLDKIVPGDCAYARFMDDWLILTKTRGQLRRIIKKMHRVVKNLKFKLALDKTYIGRIKNGFDFLGYRFSKNGVIGLAQKTIDNYYNKIATLYEQHRTDHDISYYKRRWKSWALGGLKGDANVVVAGLF
jgi:hypothetical protein